VFYARNEDLKLMLDNSKDSIKLEAMKRIIAMVARGRDATDLFPAVVKNVVSKNVEVKKLVYVYLVRYAEEQQDLALLSISTFQRALKDPNQLIRASALRVLSSIRVQVIIPIVMLAIKEAANDMSAYVRKTAAHAIPKLYSLDQEQKEELVLVIEKLLSDKATLVLGSAVMAFEEVCPERIDLIHKNYKKFCTLITDVEEWGQVIIINMLVRYARTQFEDPNRSEFGEGESSKAFYDSEDSDSSDPEEIQKKIPEKKKLREIDPDLSLLLRNCRPLLQSRNAAVVMSVAQLYHHCGPRSEMNAVAKALVRLLRSHREVQSLILNTLAALSTTRRDLFEPYLKNFFVHANDPTQVKMLKLEVMTNIASSGNISVILREFQTYISSPNKEFVTATIQAIGRCASNIKEVTESCLHGLVLMLSNRDGTFFNFIVNFHTVPLKKTLDLKQHRS
jgi:AP-3 complex subunit beta